jgi:hypothetical protein
MPKEMTMRPKGSRRMAKPLVNCFEGDKSPSPTFRHKRKRKKGGKRRKGEKRKRKEGKGKDKNESVAAPEQPDRRKKDKSVPASDIEKDTDR